MIIIEITSIEFHLTSDKNRSFPKIKISVKITSVRNNFFRLIIRNEHIYIKIAAMRFLASHDTDLA